VISNITLDKIKHNFVGEFSIKMTCLGILIYLSLQLSHEISWLFRQKYNEYVHCLKMNKRDEAECARFKGFYSQVCPNEWVSVL
jgi:hypothetical protein